MKLINKNQSVKLSLKIYREKLGETPQFTDDLVLANGVVNRILIKSGQQLHLSSLYAAQSQRRARSKAEQEKKVDDALEDHQRDGFSDDAFVAIRSDANLRVLYDDGTEVFVPVFFNLCKTDQVCSVLLPQDDKGGSYRLAADSPAGVAWSPNGDVVLSAHGEQQAFIDMLRQMPQLAQLSDLAVATEGALTYIPDQASAAALTPVFYYLPVVGGSAAAAVLLLGTESSPGSPVVELVIKGKVMLGPVTAVNDLIVRAYKADGVTQLGVDSIVDASGGYTITVSGGYQGAVTIRLSSQAGGVNDYLSEAKGVADDLAGEQLHAVGYSDISQSNSIIINITPLTDLAARKLLGAGNALLNQNKAMQATDIANVNTAISKLYLGESQQIIHIEPSGVTVDIGGSPTPGGVVSLYGLALHALSKDAIDLGGVAQAQTNAAQKISYSSDLVTANFTHAAAFDSSSGDVSISENSASTVVAFVAHATDSQKAVITYTLDGGRDKDLFNIDKDTGEVTFKVSPNYEVPSDVGGNNVYEIIVTATPNGGTSASKKVTINVTDVNFEISSLVSTVTSLDVKSNLVLQFESAVQLSTNGALKIRIVHNGGSGFHADSTWSSDVASHARDITISLTDNTQLQLSADGKSLIINPTSDLDFGSNYHIEIDAGAFINAATPGIQSDAWSTDFTTVTPHGGAGSTLANATLSKKMADNGDVVDSYKYWDIEGVGDLNTPLGGYDLSSGSYALTYKDYDTGAASDVVDGLIYSGIGTGANSFNLQVNNFGADDHIYFDDQFTNPSNGASNNNTALLELAKGITLNLLPTQNSADIESDSFVGTLQIDPTLNPTDPTQGTSSANNGAGYIGIYSTESGYTFIPNHAVITA